MAEEEIDLCESIRWVSRWPKEYREATREEHEKIRDFLDKVWDKCRVTYEIDKYLISRAGHVYLRPIRPTFGIWKVHGRVLKFERGRGSHG